MHGACELCTSLKGGLNGPLIGGTPNVSIFRLVLIRQKECFSFLPGGSRDWLPEFLKQCGEEAAVTAFKPSAFFFIFFNLFILIGD